MALRPGWFIGIFMAWLVCQIIFGITEMVYIGSGVLADTNSKLLIFLAPDPNALWTYVKNLWEMLWFNYAYLSGAWEIVRMFLRCISAGFIISCLVMLAQLIPALLNSLAKGFGWLAALFTR